MAYKIDPRKTTLSIGGKKIESQELIDNSVNFPCYGRGTLSIKYGDLLKFVDANRERFASSPHSTLDVNFKAPLTPDVQSIVVKGVITE